MSDRVNNSPSQDELSLLPHRFQVMFALFCARQAEDEWKDNKKSVEAVEIVERWLDGKATAEECGNVASAAYAAYAAYTAASAAYSAYSAAYAAVYAANAAAYSAVYAVNTSTKKELIKSQWNHYNELLHFDDIAEKTLLGGIYGLRSMRK